MQKSVFLVLFVLAYSSIMLRCLFSQRKLKKINFLHFILYYHIFMDVYFHCKTTSNNLDLVCQLQVSLNALA